MHEEVTGKGEQGARVEKGEAGVKMTGWSPSECPAGLPAGGNVDNKNPKEILIKNPYSFHPSHSSFVCYTLGCVCHFGLCVFHILSAQFTLSSGSLNSCAMI